jgi:hypothetical protein
VGTHLVWRPRSGREIPSPFGIPFPNPPPSPRSVISIQSKPPSSRSRRHTSHKST